MTNEQKIPMQSPTTSRSPILPVVGLCLLVVGIIAHLLITGTRVFQRYAPLANAAMEVKLEAAIGHLWFEEAVSEETGRDLATALEHIDRSAWYARTMIEGGESAEGAFVPIVNPVLRSEIEDVLTKIKEFRAVVEERLAAEEQSGTGPHIEERFDAVFEGLMKQADDVEMALRATIEKDMRRIYILHVLLVIFCALLVVLIGIVFRRYERRMKKLRKSEERYRAVTEDTSVLICCFLPGGEITFVNEAFCRIFDKTPEKLVGSSFLSLIPEADREAFIANISALTFKSPTQSCEHRVIAPDGEIRWQRWINRASFDANGKAVAYQSIGEDITEREQYEQALLGERQRSEEYINSLPGLFYVFDEQRFVKWNREWNRITGYSDEELAGMYGTDFFDGDDKELIGKQMLKVFREGSADAEAELVTKDGEQIPYYFMGLRKVLDGKDHLVGLGIDITERKRVEEDLAESENKFRTLVGQSTEALYLHDMAGKIVEVNETAVRDSGYSRAELLEMTAFDIDLALRDRENITDLWEQLEPFQYEIVNANHKHKKGVFYPVEMRIGKVLLKGKPYLLAFAQNIAERERAEAALREGEKQRKELATIVEQSYEGIAVADLEGNIQFANSEWATLHGYESGDELVGKHISVFHTEEQLKTAVIPFNEKVKRCGHNSGEVGHMRRDGTTFPGMMTVTMMKDEQGEPYAMAGFVRDITDRKRAEKELRESEAKYRSLFEHMENGFALHEMIFDEAGTPIDCIFLDVNEAFEKQTGIKKEHLIGRKATEVMPGISNDPADWIGIFGKVVSTGESTSFEDYLEPLGKWYSLVAYRPNEGQFATVFTDITERKLTEESRLSLERQVQHAQKLESLGVLAGGIAHDFNNLLMAVLGNAELALDELSPHAPARDNIQDIEKAAKRAAELTKQMLAYSGKGRFVIEPIDLGELVDEMSHLLEISISKKAVLKYNFADNLPKIDGDATQIRQIVMNLITNASEAIGDKSGVIALSTGAMHCDRAYLDEINEAVSTGLDESLPEGIYVYLEAADTGCGMDKETVEKVFDPFFTTKFTGRGLGMSATLGIVRGHKGTIKIYSEVGKGTTFKVLFPASGLSGEGAAILERDEGVAKDWQGKGTVLIVDDEETVCVVGKQMLQRAGFDVLIARDGRKGVDVFREHADEIVCVLLDLTMPHMDGEEAFREMRRIRSDVKVILCSGYNMQDATQRFAGKGLADFLQKPYSVDGLMKKLLAILRADRASRVDTKNSG